MPEWRYHQENLKAEKVWMNPLWTLNQDLTFPASSLVLFERKDDRNPFLLYLMCPTVLDDKGEGHGVIPLRRIGDLEHMVRIDSEEKALEFVRLLTSFSTARYLESPFEAEALPRSAFTPRMVFGNFRMGSRILSSSSGYYGVFSDEEFKAAGAWQPEVKRVEDGYLVKRLVFLKGDRLRAIEEEVSANGYYEVVSMVEPKLKKHLSCFIPMIM